MTPSMQLLRAALGLPLALLAWSPAAASTPGTWRLYQSLLASGRVEVHVAAREGALVAGARELVRRLEGETPLRFELSATGSEGDPSAARLVIATTTDRMGVSLAQKIGVHIGDGAGFELLGQSFGEPGDALLATFEDPRRTGLPVTLLLGNDLDALVAYLPEVRVQWQPSLSVWAGGDLVLRGPLRADGYTLAQETIDYRARRAEVAATTVHFGLEGIDSWWGAAPEPRRVQNYGHAMERARARVIDWLGGAAPPATIVFVRGDVAAHVDLGGRASIGHVAPGGRVAYAVCAPGLPDDGGAAVARATAIAMVGGPALEAGWLTDAIGVAAAGSWWGRPLGSWIGALSAAELQLTPAEIIDVDAVSSVSPHRLAPMRGFLLLHLLAASRNEGGAGPGELLRSLWSGETTIAADAALATSFAAAVDRAGVLHPARVAAEQRAEGVSWRGIALVDRAHDGSSDYIHPALGTSLRSAREAGANAVAITVFAALYDADKEFGDPPGLIDTPTSDLALATAFAAARAAELTPMLVLDPLAGRTGSWADTFAVFDGAGWQRFFDDFERLARHYALLAELLGCDVFCLGEGLGEASRSLPDAGAKDSAIRALKLDRWRSLVAGLRRAYGGALTYAASLPVEASEVGFWDVLDYIGLTVFPTQFKSGADRPKAAGILYTWSNALARADGLARAHEKPVLITAIGFPSVAEAWDRASVPRGEYDAEAQRRALAGLAEALGQADDARLAGFHLWLWCTDPAALGAEDRGFSPQGKPAEGVLPRLFAH